MEWVGAANYIKAFVWDINFVPMFISVVKSTLVNTPIIIVFSLFIAILLNKKIKFRAFFREIFFLPVVLGSGFIMQELIDMGVQQQVIDLSKIILLPQQVLQYLGSNFSAIIQNYLNLITLLLWKSGVQILLFLSGLQSISKSLYEAARCDSATEWEMFWKITLPMISPIILLNVVYTLVDSFTDINNPIVTYLVNVSIKQFNLEYGAAMGWIYFIFIFIMIILMFILSKLFIHSSYER